MDLLKYLTRHVTIPLYDLKEGRNIISGLRYLGKFQYCSPDEIRQSQFQRLRSIIDYASIHSAFYKKRFAEYGVAPDMLNSFDDLKRFPLLQKDDIRENLDSMISDEYRTGDLIYKRTGGSTSVPLKLYMDRQAAGRKYAAATFFDSLAGYDRGDKLAALWGNTDRKYSLKERLQNYFIGRYIFLDTLKMSHEYNMRFIERIRSFKPKILLGHAHSLYIFARFVGENKIGDLGFKGIISTAEMLYDHERVVIESVFGKILFNRYGCEELSIIAAECEEHDGLHINADGLFIEVVDGDEEVPGKLVITDLWNKGMPLIRYEIGDMATTKNGLCSCGRRLPRLGKIHGRTSDFLYSPDGKMISGISILDTFTIHIPGIKQVQIIQNKIDQLDFKLVRDDRFSDNSIRLLEANVREIFGERMKISTEIVESIKQTDRGKYRFSICNLSESQVKNLK